VHHGCDKRRREPTREAFERGSIFRNEIGGALSQLEYIAEIPVVILKHNFAGLHIRELHAQIDDDPVSRAAPLLIEEHGDGSVAEDFPCHDEVAGSFWNNLESRPSNEFLSNGFRHTLLDSIGRCFVSEGGYRNRLARVATKIFIGETISTTGHQYQGSYYEGGPESHHDDVMITLNNVGLSSFWNTAPI
jgi:hypothetical protein